MIISILGISGRDRKTGLSKPVSYTCDILGKKNGKYLNSTDMLLKNYEDIFYFLGTSEAIKFQKELLDMETKDVHFLEISHNSLDEIYEKVLTLLDNSNEDVILDVTHGFRHQPISAIFAATFHRFLSQSKLKIIFAKEEVSGEAYSYIYLDDYLDLSQLTFQLSGFSQTLNFVESAPIQGFDTSPFLRFSDALLSNDFTALCQNYIGLMRIIEKVRNDIQYKHLTHLFNTIEDDLSVFNTFDSKELYQQYFDIAALLFRKNYLLLSLTYLYESVRYYCSQLFYEHKLISSDTWKKTNRYKINQAVITFMTQKEFGEKYRATYYDKAYPKMFDENKDNFLKISNVYLELRDLRNNLTHVNPKENKFSIELKLKELVRKVEAIIEDDVLRKINIKELV